jgi:DNA-binding NtrC family response regulator
MADRGRILVVDDEENLCWILSKILSERGHEVRIALSGARALAALESFDCQVAAVDYRLPDWDGLRLVGEMESRRPRLQAILMTSYGGAALRRRVAEQQLFAFLDKPFSNDLMIRSLEEAIGAWGTGGDSFKPGMRARTLFPGRTDVGT